MTVADRIIGAFPAALAGEAKSLATLMALQGVTFSPDDFTATVGDDLILIPERLYGGEVLGAIGSRGVTCCLLTRHHDGFVRQRALRQALQINKPWAIPFIVRLVGEYVVEIVEAIDEAFSDISPDNVRDFVLSNPAFIELTHARVTSYWNCYYRQTPREKYVGFRLMERIESTGISKCA